MIRNSRGALGGAVGLVAAAVLFTGCDETSTGQLVVRLGDAPFPIELLESTEVSLTGVDVHLAGGFVSLAPAPMTVDLLELRNGVTAVLLDAEFPTGEIDQIRLKVESASLTLTDGRTFDLQIPSGSSSGIKVFPNPSIEVLAGETTEVYLDFDVSESFRPTPAAATRAEDITSFRFQPVLRVANLGETGGVAGTVTSDVGTPETADDVPMAAAMVTAYLLGVSEGATSTEPDGSYRLIGLEPGTYDIRATAAGHADTEVEATVVAADDTVDVDLLLLQSE